MLVISTLLIISTHLLIGTVGVSPELEGISVPDTPTLPTATFGPTGFHDVPPNATDIPRISPRHSCGQYKLSPGNVIQEFTSQFWAGPNDDLPLCQDLRFESGDMKGELGNITELKVEYGCTCYFYEYPCDSSKGNMGDLNGWHGWMDFRKAPRNDFKAWFCQERN